MTALAAAAASSNHTQLVIAAILGIGVVIALITWLKVHPFLALIIGSAVLGLTAGFGAANTEKGLHQRSRRHGWQRRAAHCAGRDDRWSAR